MAVNQNIRKKANTYFFAKVAFNAFLMLLGIVLIALFLRRMQNEEALYKQEINSEQVLTEAIVQMEKNARDAEELTRVFHDGNQDLLDDLNELLTSGLFAELASEDNETRTEIFSSVVTGSGIDYLFIMSDDGRILVSPIAAYYGTDLVDCGMLTAENRDRLLAGTRNEDGSITPALEDNQFGRLYFYSTRSVIGRAEFTLVLGAEASTLDLQIASLKDVSLVLSRAAIGNGGFLFAVNTKDNSFLYYRNGGEVLTGENALEAGLSEAALKSGYSGIQTINGVRYHCVSRAYGDSVMICAVADTDEIFANNKYVLFWSISGFVLVMLLCLAYAVIVRNDFVRNAVETDKKTFATKRGGVLIFDRSVFRKVFPLMIFGVLVIFGISFYTQTLLEISEGIESASVALREATGRYEESVGSRELIQNYYNSRFLAKAKMLAFLFEEDPTVLNEETDRYHSTYDEDGRRVYLTDGEGNRLRSVGSSARLGELCEKNNIESIYVFDEEGHTIATNTANWFFTISHDETAQSYPFLQVLDGKRDYFIQEAMISDVGESSQYIGVPFSFYTTVDRDGQTRYVSRYVYEREAAGGGDGEEGGEKAAPITVHRGMVQIGLLQSVSEKLLASTELSYIFSSDTLNGGFMVLFDSSENHVCLYSPIEAQIGMKAADLGVPQNAFSGSDYYGFTHFEGMTYFQYYRYTDGYFVSTALPKSFMFQARGIVSTITAVTSLLLILILSGTVTLTTEEEEMLYAAMSKEQEALGFDSAIFSVIMPTGHRVTTVKAAARWDNRRIPWSEKSPEQKLIFMISLVGAVLVLYLIITVLGFRTLFDDNSVVQYILSGAWDRSPNIFAFSACAMVLVFTMLAVALFRIPIAILTALLGARTETVGHLLISVMKYGGALGALFYCLYLVGIDSTSLLASASILSLVIGLGAQSLIKDIIAGIFIVFEGEFRVGDIVTIGGYRGSVMDIGLRTTKIMGVEGNIKIFNNSDITGVLNMTKEASVVLCKISIEYGQDLDYVEAVLRRELPALRKHNPQLLENPRYLGVQSLGESGVELAVLARCREQDIFDVTRYMNREVLQIFYRNGINVPFPNVTVSQLDTSGRRTAADLKKDGSGAAK